MKRRSAIVELGLVILILKCATASRPSGRWSEDDYDVFIDDVVVGRILKANAAPVGTRTLAFEHQEDRMPTHTAMSPPAGRRCRRLLRAGAGNERLAAGGTSAQVALASEAEGMRRTIRPVRINCTAERSPLDNSARPAPQFPPY
jgi:hypothetical protein